MTSIFINEFTSEVLKQITWQDLEKQSSFKSWLEVFPLNTQDWKNWCQHQPEILTKLGQWLWPKLDRFLQQEKIQRVVLVPQGQLFLYPLHATPFIPLSANDKKRIYPIERYTITYAPSLRLYDQLAKTDTVNLRNKKVLFVEDPDGTWGFSFAQQEWLSQKMQNRNLRLISLQKSEITAENVLKHMKDAALFHYYGHGHYDFMHPEESGLKMYSPEDPWNLLTMSKISQTLNPKPMDMAVLIACETAITDVFSHWRDQFMGLPSGFLRTGANIVVGSLWPVPVDETSLIFIRFYKELLEEGKSKSPAEALRQAQLWMLNASRREIRLAKREYMGMESGDANQALDTIEDLRSNPANWAAFYVVGNGFAIFE